MIFISSVRRMSQEEHQRDLLGIIYGAEGVARSTLGNQS